MPTPTPPQTHCRTPPHNNTATHATLISIDRRHTHEHAPHLQACMPAPKRHQSNTQHHPIVQLAVTPLELCRPGRGLPATPVDLPTHSQNPKRSTRDTHTHRHSVRPSRIESSFGPTSTAKPRPDTHLSRQALPAPFSNASTRLVDHPVRSTARKTNPQDQAAGMVALV
jgi:hypothetical protein